MQYAKIYCCIVLGKLKSKIYCIKGAICVILKSQRIFSKLITIMWCNYYEQTQKMFMQWAPSHTRGFFSFSAYLSRLP